jgi:hypothetical protein
LEQVTKYACSFFIKLKFNIISSIVPTSINPLTFNTDWREGLPIAYVPIIVAEINKAVGFHKLKLIIGVYWHDSYTVEQLKAEVSNAVGAAKDAEKVYPGSVSGISIHFNAVTMQNDEHIKIVKQSMASVREEYSVNTSRVGIRLEECDKAFNQLYNRNEES